MKNLDTEIQDDQSSIQLPYSLELLQRGQISSKFIQAGFIQNSSHLETVCHRNRTKLRPARSR